MPWTVGEAARIGRVSVRTLHHYDEIGLLCPSARSAANYRLYTARDLERLHQVRLFRELGFTLPDIQRLMLDPNFDRADALRAQRALLIERARRTQLMLQAIDAALAATSGEGTMTNEDIKTLFDGFDPSAYEDEARERWGDTDAYQQSSARTRKYTRADWAQLKAEMDAITSQYVALMDAGVAPDAPDALRVAGEHHAHLERWFYACSPAMFVGLGELWVSDERFTRNIDRARAGLAAYQGAAVAAWAARQ